MLPLHRHDREMRKYTFPIALLSILIATKIQAASTVLSSVGMNFFLTVVISVVVGLVVAGAIYGGIYWMRKRKQTVSKDLNQH